MEVISLETMNHSASPQSIYHVMTPLSSVEISDGDTLTSAPPTVFELTTQGPPSTSSYSISDIIHIVQVITLASVTTTGMMANTLVFLLFYRRPALRSFANRFVLNLSASHLLHCILVQVPMDVTFETRRWQMGANACVGTAVISIALNIASVLSLLLIALDRNCAVNSPLHYTMTITKKRTGALIISLWAMSALIAIPPLFGLTSIGYSTMWHACTMKWEPGNPYSITYGTVLFFLGFVVPFFTTSFVYSSMFQAARDSSERARKHSLNSTGGEVSVQEGPVKPQPPASSRKKFRRWSSGSSQNSLFGDEWKAIRTGLLVVLTFIFCWLPYFAVTYAEAFYPLEDVIPEDVMFFVTLCSSSSCIINPYLYVYRNKTSRKQLKKLFTCFGGNKKKWTFHRKPNIKEKHCNPCILSANLINKTSEKVEALPVVFQGGDGRWLAFGSSEEARREEVDGGATSDCSEENLDEPYTDKRIARPKSSGSINVQAIYNNNFSRNCLQRNISSNSLSLHSNKLLLFRLKTQMTHESTSSDTTENFSMSFDSSNSSSDCHSRQNSQGHFRPPQGHHSKSMRMPKDPTHSQLHRINSLSEGLASLENLKPSVTPIGHTLSYIGSVRRKSFIHSRMKNRRSSDTTSSTNSETLDSTTSTPTRERKDERFVRPKLVRQEETNTSSKTDSSESNETHDKEVV